MDLTLPKSLRLEVVEMAPLKAEETLHDYPRRYFEKASKDNARQFAEQKTITKAGVVPYTTFFEGTER